MRFTSKRFLVYSLLITLIFSSLIGCAKEVNTTDTSTPLSMEDRLEDFEYLYKIISENYPFLKVNERVNGINWLEQKEKYIKLVENSNNDTIFMNNISAIVKDLNNGHTHVVDKESFKWYYTVYTNPKYKKSNKPWSKVFKDKTVLKWYGFNEDEFENIKSQGFFGSNAPAFHSDIIIPDEVAYLKISQMNGERVEEDGKEIRKFYEEVKDYNKLIIDIRGNGGGDDLYWMKNVIEPLAKEKMSVGNYIFTRGNYGKPFYKARGMKQSPISKLDKNILENFSQEIKIDFDYYHISNRTIQPKDPIDFDGKIYLLVDKGVYSSSESFAAFCKDSGLATLVGTTTGGDGIGIDPLFFSLPNSGIVIRFSSLLALNGDGTINEEVQTPPDIEVDSEIGYSYENDKAIQYVINN
ncbi:S41 family peptidase [Tissierella carlieri]|uniref:S41 family peptidase n=1 Tax=Tissierella carlieri TaxID=689904 RepID=A0ABT1S8X1_9FIRM|nr:S41 family peptidase [Tissierella carlieri]MCQ4922914.1 S41 family peptidase [Tissierella carlieri]